MIKLNDRYDLKNIDMHCLHLSTFISHLYPQQTDIPDWLIISSGIKNVEFDVARLDMSFHVCKRAHEWISSFEDTIQKYVTELTRFTYIWGALESLVKLSGKRKRLVLQANEVLKNSLPTQGIIAPYNNLLNDLNEHIKFSQIHQGQLYKLFNPKYITNSCLGLHIINKIRNSFFSWRSIYTIS